MIKVILPTLICFGPLFITFGKNGDQEMIGLLGGVMTSVGLYLLYKMILNNENIIKLQKEQQEE